MALDRLSCELHEFESVFKESAQLLPIGDDALSKRASFTVSSLGTVSILVHYPEDYPDKPPALRLDTEMCTSADDIVERVRTVCPELVDWGQDLIFRFPELAENWDPAFTTVSIIAYIRSRLCTPAFPEMVTAIVDALPSPDAEGTVVFFFGTAGEAPPASSGASELFIFVDPHWVQLSNKHGQEVPTGPLQWTNESAHYIVLPVPYCFSDPEHTCALQSLMSKSKELGWTAPRFVQSGIHLLLPKGIPCFQYFAYANVLANGTSWDNVPACLRRCSPGETPGSYGGLLIEAADSDCD